MIEEYILDLKVDFESAHIRGNVTIVARNLEQDTLELDAEDMEIKTVKVEGRVVQFSYDSERAALKIPQIPKTSKEIHIDVAYEKQISETSSTGVFKCRNGPSYFIITDFEPDRARTFFPCKDDPLWKAVFNVSITTSNSLNVISNITLKTVVDVDSKQSRFIFNPTPKMSTYLLFVGIGDFIETSSATFEKVIVASRPEVSDKCGFTLEIAARAIKASEDYFRVPFPLQKLHIIGLTEYNGAMENWGAITASEIVSIIDEKSSSIFDRQRAALVTIHEIEHQWFGDLVTMKWWNDIWLNEGFATFMSHKILDELHPEWDTWSYFVTRYSFEARRIDALLSTHPVEAELRKISEMNEVFDSISYDKGASILRMIEDYVGKDEFRAGVSNYIKTYSYSNASSEDFWSSLERASSQPISEIMKKWLGQAGFPLVSVKASGDKLILGQRRFPQGEIEKIQTTGRDESELWPIPIVMEINGKSSKLLLKEERLEIKVPGGKLDQIIINSRQNGFYCVEYDESLLDMIAKSFHFLDGLDKAGVINDLSQLLMAGRITPKTFYKFVSSSSAESEYSLVNTVWRELELLNGIAENSTELKEISLNFLWSQINRLGLEARNEESPGDKVLREFVSYQLAKEDTSFANKMATKFSEYELLAPEIRSAAAIGYARISGTNAFNAMMRTIRKTTNEADREKLYIGLCSIEDPALIQKLLDFSASGEVPRTDVYYTLYYGSKSPKARRTVWNWVKNNFDKLWDLLGSTLFVMNVLDKVVPRVAIEDEEDARTFFLGDRLQKGEMSFRKQLELLHLYSELRKSLAK